MLKAPSAAGWDFDQFRLMPGKRLLLSNGVPVPLVAKAFDALVLLVENRDRVVSKDELLSAIWPDVAVEEGNLTQQIFLVRKALGESAQHPRYILTVPGHGYRFTAPVTGIAEDDQATRDEAASTALKTGAAGRQWSRGRFAAAMMLISVLGALTIVFVLRRTPSPTAKWLDPAEVRIQRITETGRATNVTISPDGRYAAYVGNDGDQYSLHVQQIATGGETSVLSGQSRILEYLRFSPDGEFLYFARGTLPTGFVLFRVPAIGGPETPVLDDVDSPISFSPDGSQFVFARGAGRATHIIVADKNGTAQQPLATLKGPLSFSFVAPAWSPDGKWVAASTVDQSTGRWSITLLPVGTGSRRELYTTEDRVGALRWLPDGSGLLTVLSETSTRRFLPWLGTFSRLVGGSIWRIAYPGGQAERLTSDLADYDLCCIDVTANGRMIGSVLNSLVSDLWIAPADQVDAPKQITSGNPVMARHSWLPDNNTIVYRDLRGRLYSIDRSGAQTSLPVPSGHQVAGGVSVCGNGRYVVFQAIPGNNIWRVTRTTGSALQLTSGSLDSSPACSQEGQWVLYATNRKDVSSVWRVPIEGGDPVALIPGETNDPVPSPSGRFIYNSAVEWDEQPVRQRRFRWVVTSAADGKRIFSLNEPADRTFGTYIGWAPDESGLDYVVTRKGVSNIWRQPLAGGAPVQITNFKALKIFSFAWSPDGQWLSVASGINRSDAVLITRK